MSARSVQLDPAGSGQVRSPSTPQQLVASAICRSNFRISHQSDAYADKLRHRLLATSRICPILKKVIVFFGRISVLGQEA